ncbi:hypothetical protein CHLNCDRAFT_136088 [Chlorella variabilis]|uniref:MYND-type domain-containing protein n=1 Tax=Chlorella variabilis TaxID=554065 RepID=E1ZJQ5_CHLVA|nr:hypothetical protein CHLNCDRAFT_136088 [Chlorella variabilis]EFN54031.1 hypothetical protein CHLNCDRAFT_136088 [Chlorella variabilis]|eukprot:XP_005846133.1 hypothetical protein CHLNCDRAFT_136088 [Chlorella variabilis]
MATASYITALVRRLRSGDEVRVAEAAATLAHLSRSAENTPAIVAAGGIPALVKILSSDRSEAVHARLRSSSSEAVHIWAAAALGSLSSDSPENQAAIAATGVIPALCLHSGSDNLQVVAAGAVCSLAAGGRDYSAAIAAAGGIPALQQLHSSPSEVQQRDLVPGCRAVRYCSEACAHAHWPAHKPECRRLRRAAGASQP